MSGLSRADISAEIASGNLQIRPFERDSLQPASYDLRVQEVFHARSEKRLTDGKEQLVYIIEKDQSAAILTSERIYLSNGICGHVELTNTLASKGLHLLNPGHIDPGWGQNESGVIVGYELTAIIRNVSNKAVELKVREPFLTLTLTYLKTPSPNPYRLKISETDRIATLYSKSERIAAFVEASRETENRLSAMENKLESMDATKVSWQDLLRSLSWLITGFGLVIAVVAGIITTAARYPDIAVGTLSIPSPVFEFIVGAFFFILFLSYLKKYKRATKASG
jgi:deoxycytidine triphosphate deaminase